ncbi:MAG: hypothetical protein ACI8V2_004143 [Candidatus Latescibacterota bacterium]|jgi:hypothetical protein
MIKFDLRQFKKKLEQKDKSELIQELSMLCQKFPQVKEYYQAQESGGVELLTKYKRIIQKEFVEGTSKGFPKLQFSVARKAINDFRKLSKSPELLADLKLTYVESVSEFNNNFGPDTERFYLIPEEMFNEVLRELKANDLLEKFEARAHSLVENATEGWGHFDTLCDYYEEYYGEFIR